MELGQGAFKTKKSALSLDLNDETGVSSLTVTPDQAFSDDAMNAQKQYAQGFLDALRVVQQSNKFEFTGLSPTALPMLRSTPAELMSPLLTPTNSRDMRAIMYGLLGTPGMTASQTKVMTSSNGVSPTSAPCGNGLGLDALSLPTTLALDNQSLLSLAAVALPGPPISTTTTTTSSLASSPTMPVSLANLSCLTNIATSSLPSTSRPDKFNLTPPQLRIDTVEDSDASESRSRSSSSAPSSNRREEMSMDEQERKKLERKRARNRQAASKCRQKKMERISELEQQVTNEKQRAARLDIELDQLQRALNDMQSLIASHSNRGCQSPHSQHRH